MKRKSLTLFVCALISLFSCTTTDSSTDVNTDAQNNNAGTSGTAYTVLAEEVLAELNFVRTNPKKYAHDVLTSRLQAFDGTIYTEQGKTPLATQEGVALVKECIDILNTAQPAAPLSLEWGLCLSAQWLADDQGRNGLLGHTGSDGSSPSIRMNRYGTWGILCGENCAYGSTTAREIVAQLLIDDGVPDRGHRINILKKEFRKVGFGFSDKENAPYGAVAVMDFAGSYTSD